jgi:hypothetical protein
MSQSVISIELIHSYDQNTDTADISCDVITGVLRCGQYLGSANGPKVDSISKTTGGKEIHQANMSLGFFVVTLSNFNGGDIKIREGSRYRTYTAEELKTSKYKKVTSN